MSRLPYPGIVKAKEAINLAAVAYKNPLGYFYFEFNSDTKPRKLLTIGKNIILLPYTIIAVEEIFTGAGSNAVYINLGTSSNPVEAGKSVISSSTGWAPLDWAEGILLLKKLRHPTNIFMSISGSPTSGLGWGLLQYLDLNRVERIR